MRAHFRTHALALLLIEGRVQVEMNVILGGAALGAIYALATAHIRMSRFGDERYVLDKRAFPDRRAVLAGDAVKRSTVRRQMFPVPEFDMGSFCRGDLLVNIQSDVIHMSLRSLGGCSLNQRSG